MRDRQEEWYVGRVGSSFAEIFVADRLPTRTRYPRFRQVVGPFTSARAAKAYVEDQGLKLSSMSLVRRNPVEATEIYDKILAIEAEKGQNSLWPKERFRHDFSSGGKIIGLPNGDLLIKRKKGKKLWKRFQY